MYSALRRLLFRLDPETAHSLTLHLVRLAGLVPPVRGVLAACFVVPAASRQVFGLDFPNPVGLAAGYDKDAIAVRGLAALGFGHIELGTVTPRPQPGNPRRRVFRLVEDDAVINRMGFPSQGAERVALFLRRSLSRRKSGNFPIIGVNLGKNKDTPLEEAARDYVALIRAFAPLADYLAINVSSPNTANLRRLQARDMLEALLVEIRSEHAALKSDCPLLVKLAPDLSDEELRDALDVIVGQGMDGVIATNTTLGRDGLHSPFAAETGGLSGRPLRERSTLMLEKVLRLLDGRLPVISVGGIMTPEDARRRLDMGAALVQLYTGLIYAGPALVKQIVCRL